MFGCSSSLFRHESEEEIGISELCVQYCTINCERMSGWIIREQGVTAFWDEYLIMHVLVYYGGPWSAVYTQYFLRALPFVHSLCHNVVLILRYATLL